MRMTAPAISGAAVVLAAALVWYLRPDSEPAVVPNNEAVSVQPVPVVNTSAARSADTETRSANTPVLAEAPVPETGASPAPSATESPLPGQTPSTPMANLLANRERELPPGMVAGEREFAAEPVDATWAPGAEADLLATFAQMPGLQLFDLQVECRSTMCRLQLTQPSGSQAVDGGPRPFNILLDSVGLEPRWMMAIQDRTGPMRSVAYLWREGFAPQREAGEQRETD